MFARVFAVIGLGVSVIMTVMEQPGAFWFFFAAILVALLSEVLDAALHQHKDELLQKRELELKEANERNETIAKQLAELNSKTNSELANLKEEIFAVKTHLGGGFNFGG